MASEITYNSFEISLMVFVLYITTNHAIYTYKNTMFSCINMLPALDMTTVFCLNDIIIQW